MNEICSSSSATTTYAGTYATMYSIMGIIEGVSALDYETIIVLEIDMTILCKTSPRLFELQTQHLNLLS